MINQELVNLQVGNNAHQQSALAGIAEHCTAITAASQQQIAPLTVQVPTVPPAMTKSKIIKSDVPARM